METAIMFLPVHNSPSPKVSAAQTNALFSISLANSRAGHPALVTVSEWSYKNTGNVFAQLKKASWKGKTLALGATELEGRDLSVQRKKFKSSYLLHNDIGFIQYMASSACRSSYTSGSGIQH